MFLSSGLAGAVLAIFSALFLALGVIFIRRATVTDDSLTGVFPISLIGFVIYFPLSVIIHYSSYGLSIRSFLIFALSGFLASFLARASYYKGVERIGASWSAPIKNASMVVSSIIGIALLGEIITSGHVIGIALIALGVIILGYKISSDGGGASLAVESSYLNLAFPAGALLFFGISNPLMKVGLSEGTPVLVGLTVMHLAALVSISSLFLLTGRSFSEPFRAGKRKLYIAAGLSLALGLGLMFFSLEISRVIVTIPLKSTSPLFVLILSYIFMRDLEKITRILILGSIAIVAGTVLIGIFM